MFIRAKSSKNHDFNILGPSINQNHENLENTFIFLENISFLPQPPSINLSLNLSTTKLMHMTCQISCDYELCGTINIVWSCFNIKF